MERHSALLRAAFDRAIDAVSASACLPQHLPGPSQGRTYVVAVGKAAGAMAEVASRQLKVDKALVVFPPNHGPSLALPPQFELIESGHPVPDENSVRAADRALELASELGPGDRLIALISGGGSALMAAPVDGITLADKQALTRDLLVSGASIAEINCVRQCLSRVKGGRLARAAGGAEVLTFAISDIPGDDISLVASGPTLSSSASLIQARAIFAWRGIQPPQSVAQALKDPGNAPVEELDGAVGTMIASPAMALKAAAQLLEEEGYWPMVLGDSIEGEASELAMLDARIAQEHFRPGHQMALISGGETTVRLPPSPPIGGRNMEYALSLAISLQGNPRIFALACDSDGIDGTTPAAGAIIGPKTIAELHAGGIDPNQCLNVHDAFPAFDRIGALVMTGPTRTNVNDIRIMLIEP